jgi:hypothetical protein
VIGSLSNGQRGLIEISLIGGHVPPILANVEYSSITASTFIVEADTRRILDITSEDIEGFAVTTTVSDLPLFATYNSAAGPFITFAPSYSEIGTYSPFAVTLADPNGQNTYYFNVTVENYPPQFLGTIPSPVLVKLNEHFTIDLSYIIDPDGQTVTLSVTMSNGNCFPNFIEFTGTVLSITPSAES